MSYVYYMSYISLSIEECCSRFQVIYRRTYGVATIANWHVLYPCSRVRLCNVGYESPLSEAKAQAGAERPVTGSMNECICT
jgi:hypothetical protein